MLPPASRAREPAPAFTFNSTPAPPELSIAPFDCSSTFVTPAIAVSAVRSIDVVVTPPPPMIRSVELISASSAVSSSRILSPALSAAPRAID